MILSITAVLAQDACPALVEQALTAMGDNCTGLERNSACYGYNQVEATFAGEVPDDFFSQPADKASLTNLSTIRTAALDLINDRWGVAVMSVQANVPNTLPGQSVTFLLMGDAELSNQVDPEAAFSPADALTAQTTAATSLFQGPSATSQALLALAAGDELLVDAKNVDGAWLRATVGELVGWVPAGDVSGDGLGDLPVLSSATRTPMQAFYFSTGIGQPECNEAQSVVAVQSPENLQVELTVNGVDIRVGSTVTFQNTSPNTFVMTVHEGEVVTSDGQVIPAGSSIEATMDENGNIIAWGPVREATPEELELGQQAIRGYAAIGIEVQIIDDEPDSDTTTEDGEIIHIVQPGETLFGIAQLYNASMPAIVARNGIVNPAILFVGQRLVIPNPGSGFVGLPGTTPPGTTTTTTPGTAPISGTGCGGFRPTSPLDGMSAGVQTFYWDPAPGASSYRLRIFNNQGAQVFESTTTETSMMVDTSVDDIGGVDAAPFSWAVEALSGGAVICRSETVVTQREWPYAPPVPTVTASWACGAPFTVDITWGGFFAGELVDISFSDTGFFNYNYSGTGPSGSVSLSVFGYPLNAGTVMGSASGYSVTLPAGLNC